MRTALLHLVTLLGAIAPTALLAAEGDQPVKVGSGVATTGLAQMVTGLLVVLALIFVAAWLYRRFGRMPFMANGAMKILGVLSLGTRERIVLLQVGEQQLLVGIAPGQMRTLHVLEEPLSAAVPAGHAGNDAFSQKLAAFMQGKKS